MSKLTRKVSSKRKRDIRLHLIQLQINEFIDGKRDHDEILCYWCKNPVEIEDLTLDHVKELNNGGEWYDLNNIVLACQECNNLRSNSPEKFKEKLNGITN